MEKKRMNKKQEIAMLKHLIRSVSSMLESVTRQVESAKFALVKMEKRADCIEDALGKKEDKDGKLSDLQ